MFWRKSRNPEPKPKAWTEEWAISMYMFVVPTDLDMKRNGAGKAVDHAIKQAEVCFELAAEERAAPTPDSDEATALHERLGELWAERARCIAQSTKLSGPAKKVNPDERRQESQKEG